MNQLSRRAFVTSTLVAAGCATTRKAEEPVDPNAIIDIHQHTNYSGRSDEQLLAHQSHMGIAITLLLPAGRPLTTPSTHEGKSNGLAAQCGPNETCYRIVQQDPKHYRFYANEVPDIDGARQEIEKYLKLGAIGIGEQKFNVDVDSPGIGMVIDLAREYRVPILMHFQHGAYNHGYDRFHRLLAKHPTVNFIGHAQTVWANIDKAHVDDAKNLYPKGPVTPGGLTDRYLADYPNFYADLSAGSGLNALNRDVAHAHAFLRRHRTKLLYGSDCNDRIGHAPTCQGAITIATLRRLCEGDAELERNLLYDNAAKLFRL
jgi:predicted TIM-barrel fold metal-dependent hydrolase